METEDLARTLGTVEDDKLEFKESSKNASTRDKIGRTICAMANDLTGAGGGDILIGVDDRGEPLDDVDVSDGVLLALAAFRDDGRILDRPSLTVSRAIYRGKNVIRLHVEPSDAPPVRFDNIVYVRPGPTTRKAHADDERILAERRRANDLPFDLRSRPSALLEDLNVSLFMTDYLPSVVAPEVIAENGRPQAQQLTSLHITDANGIPTVLGLLVIGYEARTYVPGAYVQYVRYAGSDKAADIADDQELGGNLIAIAQRLEPVLRANNRVALEPDGSTLTERRRPEYPLEAIREAVMNAIMHRDYEVSNAPVQIDWFEDRIQISNPGGPFGWVTSANYASVNDYRNPSLAAAMKHLTLVNRFGRGITRIKRSMEANGNPEPKFIINDAYWAVVLRSGR